MQLSSVSMARMSGSHRYALGEGAVGCFCPSVPQRGQWPKLPRLTVSPVFAELHGALGC